MERKQYFDTVAVIMLLLLTAYGDGRILLAFSVIGLAAGILIFHKGFSKQERAAVIIGFIVAALIALIKMFV